MLTRKWSGNTLRYFRILLRKPSSTFILLNLHRSFKWLLTIYTWLPSMCLIEHYSFLHLKRDQDDHACATRRKSHTAALFLKFGNDLKTEFHLIFQAFHAISGELHMNTVLAKVRSFGCSIVMLAMQCQALHFQVIICADNTILYLWWVQPCLISNFSI